MFANITECRASQQEQERINSLFSLMPETGRRALDIGARDGFLSFRLAERFESVVALDLDQPDIDHPRIQAVTGDVTSLKFPDAYFDAVLCAEVLEHIPKSALETACREITRVTRGVAVIGVPYRQDLRCGETTCYTCGMTNPPWGHVNSFDEQRLQSLFPGMKISSYKHVGSVVEGTNPVSVALLRFAGNPFGTYIQDEPCVHCGAALIPPPRRTLAGRLATRAAFLLNKFQSRFIQRKAIWLNVRLSR